MFSPFIENVGFVNDFFEEMLAEGEPLNEDVFFVGEFPEFLRSLIESTFGKPLSELFAYFSDYEEVGDVDLEELGLTEVDRFDYIDEDDEADTAIVYAKSDMIVISVYSGDVNMFILPEKLKEI